MHYTAKFRQRLFPRDEVLRHVVRHLPVLALDVPVPQKFFRLLSPDPEQVIEVPRSCLSMSLCAWSCVLRSWQNSWCEVPTIICFSMISLLHALLEISERAVVQNVDIPAVGGSGAGGFLFGFLPGQVSSETAEQIADNPVRPGGAGDLQGFPRRQGSTALAAQIPEFQDPGGGRHDFSQSRAPKQSSWDSPGQAGQRVFRTFPHVKKKCDSTSALGGRNCGGTRGHGRRQLMPCRRILEREERRRRVQEEAAEAMDRVRLLKREGVRREGRGGRRGGRGSLVPLHIPRVAALVVDSGSGMLVILVFLVMILHALCSLCLSA